MSLCGIYMIKAFSPILSVMLALLIAGCRTDPAVSLAKCIEVSSNKLIDLNTNKVTENCNIGLTRSYVAVIHPALTLDDKAYIAHGLDVKNIKILRSLREVSKGHESIYIIPFNDQELPSRTTSQGSIISVRELIVVRKSEPFLRFTLEWFPDGIKVIKLE